MSRNRAALANRAIDRAIETRAIVPEIRGREAGGVLEVGGPAESLGRAQRIVGAIDRPRERYRRKPMTIAQGTQCRLIAYAVVDAEVDVAGIDAVQLEAIVDAGRRALEHLTRERRAGSESLVDVDARCAPPVRENARRNLIGLGAEPGLVKVHARTVRRSEVARSLVDDAAERVAKDEPSVERAREQIADGSLHVEMSGAPEEVVMREPAFHLEEVDRVESCAQPRFAERRFGDGHDQNFRRIALPWNLDRRALEEIRLVKCALAAQQFGALEKIAGVQSQRLENRSRFDLAVAFDDYVGDCRDPPRIEIDVDRRSFRGGIHNNRRVDDRVSVALVPERLRQKYPARVELDEIERILFVENESVRDLAIR